MAIDPNTTDTVSIPQLEPLALTLGTLLVGANANGRMGNFTAQDYANFIAPYVSAIGSSSFLPTESDNILPDGNPGDFTIVGSGTFTQDGGPDVVTTALINIVGFGETVWGLVTEINPDNLVTKDFYRTINGFPDDLETTVYNYNSGAPFTEADPAEDPQQSHSGNRLHALLRHGPSDLAIFHTGYNIDNSDEFHGFTVRFSFSTLNNNPSVGLIIGDIVTPDWLSMLYSANGGIVGIRTDVGAVGFVSSLRASGVSYAYTASDEVTIQYISNLGIIRTTRNGVVSPDVFVGFKTGDVYICSRGTFDSVIEFDLMEHFSPEGFGENYDTRIIDLDNSTTERFEDLPIRNYNFEGFDTTQIEGFSATALNTEFAINEDGLDINYTGGATATAFYTDLGFDESKPVYQMSIRFKIVSLGTNPIVGYGFGIYGTNMHAFGYRQDGSMSFNINNVFSNPRGATPSLAYVVGDIVGLDFKVNKTAGTVIVKSVKNDVVDPVEFVIAPTTFTNGYVYLRSPSRTSMSAMINQLQTIGAGGLGSGGVICYIDPVLGVDTNDGTEASPFKTTDKAKSVSLGVLNSKWILKGVTRLPLDLTGLTAENIEMCGTTPDLCAVMGSDSITGWAKTSGRTNVYEATFAGTIIAQSRAGSLIYEYGNPSYPITANKRHSLQRGLGYRAPFTIMNPVASIALVDSTPSSYFVTGGKMYIHATGSTSPLTNGFTYENIARAAVISPTFTASRKANITVKNIQFLFHTGAIFSSFNVVTRHSCTSLVSSDAGGFVDDNSYTITYKDESGFCNGDGINGHYTTVAGYTTKDQREGVMVGRYFDAWCHDNYDDGLSFHERADITLNGGLFEYNGDGGVRQSNDALFRIFNAWSRNNGWDLSAGTRGSGFDMVNSASANRLSGWMELFNCISEENRNGVGIITGEGVLSAYNVLTLNNTNAEFLAENGLIRAYDCRFINSDVSKRIVKSGTGDVVPINGTILTP